MADGQSFDSLVELEVGIDQGSLRDARSTIEDGLGDVEATVSPNGPAYSSGGGGGGDVASRERAMSRQLLSSQNNKLDTVTDSWSENLELNEYRNFLLEELLESTTGNGGGLDGAKPRGGGGLLGGLALGAGALGLGALSLLGLGAKKLGELEVPDIPPLEVPDLPPLKVPDVPKLGLPDIPKLGVPDIPDLGVPDIPDLGVPDVPDLGVPDIPTLGVPDVPDLGVPDIPDLGVPNIPTLGVPEIPDLGVPDLPTLEVPDIPPIPIAKPDWVPLPIEDPTGSGSGDGSPSLADRLTAGVTSNAAMTWDILQKGGQGALDIAGQGVNYAKENPWKTGGLLTAAGLAASDGPLPIGDSAAVSMLPMFGFGDRGNNQRTGNSSRTTFSRPPTPRKSTVLPPSMRPGQVNLGNGNSARERRQQSGNVTVRQNVTVEGINQRELSRELERAKSEILEIVRREFGG